MSMAMKARYRWGKQCFFKSQGRGGGEDGKVTNLAVRCGKERSPSKFQLEQDVHQLERLLKEELTLRTVLENAMDHAVDAVGDLSQLPEDAKELLSNIAGLENTVSKLEEQVVSLHFQLIQERNERRLTEYQYKQLPARSAFTPDVERAEILGVSDDEEPAKDKKRVVEISQTTLLEKKKKKKRKDVPLKAMWKHPNQLSEEMVRCMKDIFISLAESSNTHLKPSTTRNMECSTSPYGLFSNLSLWSESTSGNSSVTQSPQVDLEYNRELLTLENSFDPYKVRGKLSWVDIGPYSLAVEVSWMSVKKKQLEYAAEELRRFRSLIEQLAKVNPMHLNDNEKLAFWINIYNALMMHAYLAYGVPKNDFKLFSLMQKAAYTVGGYSFNAASIEYVLLKMKPPVHRPQMAFLLALHKLKLSEVQRKFSIATSEPLAVFALSSGMYSSPAVRVYSSEHIHEELQEAQGDYMRASVGLSSRGKLLVPKMVYHFARGFVDDANVGSWVARFLPPKQAAYVEQCMSQRRQSFLSSRTYGVLLHDTRFRYLFLPEVVPYPPSMKHDDV